MIKAAEDAQGWSYSWIIRWRADYRPDLPLPPLSHEFWDGKGLKGGGWWSWDWGDDGDDGVGGFGGARGGGVASVYVPFVPGFHRVFTHHTWPVADFISIIPRRLMTAAMEDVTRSIWACHRIADAVAFCSPQAAYQFDHAVGRTGPIEQRLWAECVYTLHLRQAGIAAVPLPPDLGSGLPFGWTKVSWGGQQQLVFQKQQPDAAPDMRTVV